MSIIDRMMTSLIRRYTKESMTANPIIQANRKQVIWTPNEFKTYAKEGYKMNVYVYACVNQIAKNFSGVPWNLYQKKSSKSGKDTEIENHPIIDLMNHPNPFMGGTKFRENLIAFLMIDGNSYLERVGPLNKPPKEIYALRPDRIEIVPGTSQQMVNAYNYTVDDFTVRIDAPFIMHLKMFDPLDDWHGMSPMEASSRSIDQNNEARKWNVETLQNDCVAPGILETEKGLTDIQFDRLENNWRDKYNLQGIKYMAGTPMILEGGLKWTSMGMSPKDMSWLEGSKLSAREIAIAYNIAPELIGDNSNKTYSNYKEARKALYEENILPLLDWFKDEINNWLVPLYGNDKLFLDYDKDEIEALQEDRDAVWNRANSSKFLTINEKRALVGYEDLTDEEGGKLILVGSSDQDITALIPSEGSEEIPPAGNPPPNPNVDKQGNPIAPTKEQVVKSREYLRSSKAVSRKTDSEKVKYEQQVQIRREPFAIKAKEIISNYFNKERKLAVKYILNEGRDSSNVFRMVENNQSNWKTILKGIYVATADEFGKDLIRSYKSLSGYEMKVDLEIPDEMLYDEVDIARQETLKWLEENSAEKVTGITETTREALRSELAKGVDLGESIQQLAARIDNLYLNNFMKNRSEMIARTEVVSASNLGSRAAAKALDIPEMKKEWLSTADGRTREWHVKAHGQQQDLDTPYTVNGEKLMFPGDSSMGATASNLVQCRCVETYEVPGNQ